MSKKDWTGNKKTTFVQLGASSHSDGERESNDFYATDPNSLRLFLDRAASDGVVLQKKVWEPACGMGHLSEVLLERGHEVKSTDLIDRGYVRGESGVDFLRDIDGVGIWDGDILTNPPYKYAQEFVEKALDLVMDGRYVIMFLKIQFLEGKARRKLYDEYPPKYIYVNSSRQTCYINGDMSVKMSSASCYCWFVWEKGCIDEPVIRWI